MLFHMFGKVGTTIIKSALIDTTNGFNLRKVAVKRTYLVIVKTKSTHEIINLIDVVRQHCPSMMQAGIDNFPVT